MEKDAQRSESSKKVVCHSSERCGEDSQRKTKSTGDEDDKSNFHFFMLTSTKKLNKILREEIKTAGKILREEKQCWVTGRLGGRKQVCQTAGFCTR